MDMTNLFNGIAVVIDDQIGEEGASIDDIIRQIKERKMPYFTSKELPEDDTVRHFGNASFLILDWKLQPTELNTTTMQEGVGIPSTLSEAGIEENINFLKLLMQTFFAPIFIFTNEDKATVIDKLKEHNLYQDDKPNVILVKNKDELTGDTKLFAEIEDWVKRIPSIYVLKEWDRGYQNAKNQLFKDFYERSPFWPEILWKAYEEDKINMSRELGEIVTRNLYSRIEPFKFENSILKTGTTIDPTEIRGVLEGERFIKVSQLNVEDIFTGDIFKIDGDSTWLYRLNIRAQCDLRDKNPELYCLRGRAIEEAKINRDNGISFQAGEFLEKKHQAIVSCLDDGKIIEFSFRDIDIRRWNTIKEKRIGRLLPPYITRIQQLYSLYFQRIGLPRTPDEILSVEENAEITVAMKEVAATVTTNESKE